jgi:hypothetical protein
MSRVWAFAANAALGFGSVAMLWELVLGHNPATIVTRACLVMLISGFAGFFFRWALARWMRPQAGGQAQAAPAGDKKAPAPAAKGGR